MVKPQKTNGSP